MVKVKFMLMLALAIMSTAGTMCPVHAQTTSKLDCQNNTWDCYTDSLRKLEEAKRIIVDLQRDVISLQKDTASLRNLIDLNKNQITQIDNETKVIRPGGRGCILVPYGYFPSGWRAGGHFGILHEKSSSASPFNPGGEFSPNYNYIHGDIVCGL